MKTKRKILSILCTILLLGTLSVGSVQAASNVPATRGIVDEEGYTIISTVAELNTLLRSNLSGYYRLGGDLNVSASSWNPIGNQSSPFSGILDGNGYKIYGLWSSKSGNNRGLFGWLSGATITNLTIELDRRGFTSVGSRVGALAGNAYRGTLIENVHVTGPNGARINTTGQFIGGMIGAQDGSTVAFSSVRGIGVSGSISVGGLVGQMDYASTVNDSYTDNVSVNATSDACGGYVGRVAHDSRLTSTYSINTDVKATTHAGGFVGVLDYSTAENCGSSGMVRVGYSYTGGFVGEMRGARVANSYSQTSVTGNSYVGGFVGTASKASNITPEIYNCYSASSVFATISAGMFLGRGAIVFSGNNYYDYNLATVTEVNGIGSTIKGSIPQGKYTADMMKQQTYLGWNFSSDWIIEESVSYPHPSNWGWWNQPAS